MRGDIYDEPKKEATMKAIKKKLTARQLQRARVKVAKDVLAQLALGTVEAISGRYVVLPETLAVKSQKEDFGDFIKRSEKAACENNEGTGANVCQGCAVGTMLIARVFSGFKLEVRKLKQSFDVKGTSASRSKASLSSLYGTEVKDALADIFSRETLDLIDELFERSYYNFWSGYSDKTRDSPALRLGVLMRNIIRNGGELVYPR